MLALPKVKTKRLVLTVIALISARAPPEALTMGKGIDTYLVAQRLNNVPIPVLNNVP